MPSVVNGIGTWYYGKRQRFTRPGTCAHCGKDGVLSSYDTTEYVVVFFVPLFPLRQRWVIDDCPACHRHRAMSLREWRELRAKTIGELEAKYLADRANAEAAKELLHALAGFQDLTRFRDRSPHIAEAFAENAEVLQLVADVNMFFGDLAPAEEMYRRALARNDTPDNREHLAEVLIRLGRPEEAAPLLAHIVEKEIQDRLWHLMLLVQGYQSKGLHEEALHVLDQCATIAPGVDKDKQFKRLRKLSEKHRGKGKAIQSKDLTRQAGFRDSRLGAAIAGWIGPVLAVAAVAAYLAAAYWQGQRREIYLVNGLDQPYRVKVNGATCRLQPGLAVPLRVAEGRVTIAAGDGMPIEAQTVTISTPFWTRIFLNRTFAVNPDGAAVLIWQKVYYGPAEHDGPEGETRFSVAQALHEFRGVSYRFEDFPETLSLSSSKPEARTRVSLFPTTGRGLNGHWALLRTVEKRGGSDAAARVAAAYLRCVPDSTPHLRYVEDFLPPAQQVALLRPLLDRTPVPVPCHTAYQDALERAEPDADIEGEYRQRLAADPTNPHLQYLAGRALTDLAAGRALIEQAASGPTPDRYALQYLAVRCRRAGDLKVSVDYARKAVAAAPEDQTSALLLVDELLAAREFAEAEKLAVQQTQARPEDWGWQNLRMQCRVRLDQADQAVADIDAIVKAAARQNGPERGTYVKQTLERWLAYFTGDVARFCELAAKSAEPDDRFEAAVVGGDLAAARAAGAALSPLSQTEGTLTMYVMALVKGDAAQAAEVLPRCLERLNGEGRHGRLLAEMLAGRRPVDMVTVVNLRLNRDTYMLALAALGRTRPETQAVCYPVVRRSLVRLDFPAHLIAAATKETP